MFIPRINNALKEFCSAWNNHRIRTAHNKSPHQLFTAGLLLLQHAQLTAMDFFEEVNESYGLDNDGPLSLDEEATLAVPHLNFELQSGDLEHLRQTVDPLARSDNFGIEQTVHFISHTEVTVILSCYNLYTVFIVL